MRSTRIVVLAVAAGLLAPSSVAGATPPSPPPTVEAADVAASIEATGVFVVDSVSDTGDGITVTRAQLEVMAREVTAGAGILGAELDAVTPMPEGAPPFSYLLAAWLHDALTPRAELAQGWYPADADWTIAPALAFPRAVLLLFVADIAEEADEAAPPLPADDTFVVPAVDSVPSNSVAGLRASALAPACGLINGFFTNQIVSLFNMLRLGPDFLGGGVLGFVGGIVATLWNTALSLAADVVQGLVRNLGEPVLQAIGQAIAVAGIVSQISTYIGGWHLQLTSHPDQLTFAVGDAPDNEGVFEVSEASGYRPWQPELEQCARALQIELPRVLAPGSEVRWEVIENSGEDGRAPMIIEQSRDDLVPDDGYPAFRFVAGREESAEGSLGIGRATVGVRVSHAELSQVLALAQRIVDDTIANIVNLALPVPALADRVRSAIQDLVRPLLDQLRAAITNGTRSVFELYAQDAVMVYYHKAPSPTTSTPTTTPRTSTSDPSGLFCDRFLEGATNIAANLGELMNVANIDDLSQVGVAHLNLIDETTPMWPSGLQSERTVLIEFYTALADGAYMLDLFETGQVEAYTNAATAIWTYCGIDLGVESPG